MSKAQSFAALKAEIAELELKAAAARKAEVAEAVASIRKTMETYGLTAADLGLRGERTVRSARTSSKRAGAGVPRYRDPQTGKTWTGFGKPPGWIATAHNREAFLIRATASADGGAASKPATTEDIVGVQGPTGNRSARGAAKGTRPVAAKSGKRTLSVATAPTEKPVRKSAAKALSQKPVRKPRTSRKPTDGPVDSVATASTSPA